MYRYMFMFFLLYKKNNVIGLDLKNIILMNFLTYGMYNYLSDTDLNRVRMQKMMT